MTTELFASSQTPIARMGDLSKLRPDRLLHSINRALELGFDHEDIAKDARFQSCIEHLLREFEVRQGMFAPSTQRRLNQSWKIFVCWCEQTNKQPLPASPSMIEQYLLLRGEQFHRNTLNVDRWAISTVHQAAGCPDPTRDLIVRQTMRVIVKKKVRIMNETVKQAPPFRDSDLDVLTSIWKDSTTLSTLRNLAMMTVAYETLLRSQELANMKLEHIKPLVNGGASVEIPFTKTNQSGDAPNTAA
ncbi:integrase-like protein [Vibrio ponticus]|nr:integrase-like protein [Vibrio ponticus]